MPCKVVVGELMRAGATTLGDPMDTIPPPLVLVTSLCPGEDLAGLVLYPVWGLGFCGRSAYGLTGLLLPPLRLADIIWL